MSVFGTHGNYLSEAILVHLFSWTNKKAMVEINPFHAEYIQMPHPLLIFSQSVLLDPGCWYKFSY